MAMNDAEYNKWKASGEPIVWAHCRSCIRERPKTVAPINWMSLECSIDPLTGVLYLACRRCSKLIVEARIGDLLQRQLLSSRNSCELCDKEEGNHADH